MTRPTSPPNSDVNFYRIVHTSSTKFHCLAAFTSWDIGQYLAPKSALKMMKNDFYFTWKAAFVLKILKFLS